MKNLHNMRPDPEELLRAIRHQEEDRNAGRLKVFFGMCAGVGKTYEMLKAAHTQKQKGIDVVIGYIETHKRPETEVLVQGLEVIPRCLLGYRETMLEEMDLDAVLARKPALVLVDELAHTNAPGSRHPKRYQDVMELLENGISVYTTLNVQHLESRADTVAQITGAQVRETVPDSIFAHAYEVELVDISPDELLDRLAQGKVYAPEQSGRAREHFFRKGNLTALREMALRLTAERVDHQLREYMRGERIQGPWKSGQRLVVAISPSPHSAKVIRWARRTAYTLNASWVAVYVELPRPLSAEARRQLEENIRLAGELGAEVTTTADVHVGEALLRVARLEHATHILVGKSGERSPFWHKSLFRYLLEDSSNLDIYIVGGEGEQPGSMPARILPQLTASWKQYAAVAAVVMLVAMICFPLRELLGYQTISLVLILAVALLALRFSAGPILLGAALSAAIWNFFFIPPLFTMAVAEPEDVLMLLAYFIIALVTGVLSARTRANDAALRLREERASALYAITRDLSRANTVDGVVAAAVASLKRFFQAEVAVFLSTPDGDLTNTAHPASTYAVDEKEFGVAAWAYWNERKAGCCTDTLPSAQGMYVPLTGPRYALGVIGMKFPTEARLTLDQESLLQNFMNQIASALERESLNTITARAMVVAESERLYKTLFDSISHEIRTPLSAIAGSAEELASGAGGPVVQQQLAADIQAASERLNRLVDNLLDMTRIESGLIHTRLDWCDIRDILNAAVEETGHAAGGRAVTVDVRPEVPLLKLDFGLIQQAVTNILYNALLYSPPGTPVEVRAMTNGVDCLVAIADHGPGIRSGMEEKIFEKFYRAPGTKAGGTGLGLSIVRGFVQAHGGTVTARNRSEGGAEFILRLPIKGAAGEPGQSTAGTAGESITEEGPRGPGFGETNGTNTP